MKKEPMVYRNIRMPKSLDDKARKEAQKEYLTLSAWIRALIIKALKKVPAVLLIVFISACSALPTKTYDVYNVRLRVVVMDEAEIARKTFELFGSVKGAYILYGNPTTIYVPYGPDLDRRGNNLPDFKFLGHEVWHLNDFGGRFHD